MWLVQRYLDRVIIASLTDRDLLLAFFSVAHMLSGPASLFRPAVMARVLWHALTHRGTAGETQAHLAQPPPKLGAPAGGAM